MTIKTSPILTGTQTTFRVRPSVDHNLFIAGPINLSDGVSLKSSTDDGLTRKGLELNASTIRLDVSSKLSIITTPLSDTAQGIVTSHSGPASGSRDTSFFFNSLAGNWRSAMTGRNGPVLFSAAMNLGGANYDVAEGRCGLFIVSHTVNDTCIGDKVALTGAVGVSATSPGKVYSLAISHTINDGASCGAAYGIELDSAILGTGVAPWRIGVHMLNLGTKTGTTADAAFAVGCGGGSFNTGAWKTGLMLFSNGGTLSHPLQSTGDVIGTDDIQTIANVINLPGWTVTGAIIKTGRLTLSMSADGVMLLRNAAADNFTKIQFGGTTSSFPALKRSGSGFAFTLADDSDFAGIVASRVNVSTDFRWNNGSIITQPADGIIKLENNAGTGFSRLQFGVSDSTGPAIVVSGTEMHAKLADNSAFTPLRFGFVTKAGAFTSSDVADGSVIVGYDSSGGTRKLYVNQGGTLYPLTP